MLWTFVFVGYLSLGICYLVLCFFFRSFCRVGFFFWPGPTRPRPSTEGEINKVFVVFVDGSPSIFLRRSARKFATGGPLVSSCHSTVTVAFISLCFFLSVGFVVVVVVVVVGRRCWIFASRVLTVRLFGVS